MNTHTFTRDTRQDKTYLEPLNAVVRHAEAVVVVQEQRLPQHLHGQTRGRLWFLACT